MQLKRPHHLHFPSLHTLKQISSTSDITEREREREKVRGRATERASEWERLLMFTEIFSVGRKIRIHSQSSKLDPINAPQLYNLSIRRL